MISLIDKRQQNIISNILYAKCDKDNNYLSYWPGRYYVYVHVFSMSDHKLKY